MLWFSFRSCRRWGGCTDSGWLLITAWPSLGRLIRARSAAGRYDVLVDGGDDGGDVGGVVVDGVVVFFVAVVVHANALPFSSPRQARSILCQN